MPSSNTIPLVRAVVMEPYIEAARQIGSPVEKILRSVGLPTELEFNPELLLLEPLCWNFAQLISRMEGIPNFGLIAGNTIAHQDISTVALLLAGCTNLYDLLKRFCTIAPLYSNSNLYVLEDEEHVVRLTQKGFRFVAEDIQVQLFEVLGTIQLVQLAAGTNWRPDEIYFTFERQTEVEYARELNPSRIHFSQRYPSIAVPRNLLSLPVSLPGTYTELDTDNSENLASIPDSLSQGLRDAITPYLGTAKLNKSFAAEITGLSPRTLNRRLSEQNTSYSRVIDQARLMRAATLLKETDVKLLDITLMLGYENASSFTRAFRRWAGISPREYRYLHFTA